MSPVMLETVLGIAGQQLALILRADFFLNCSSGPEGIRFLTPDNYSQQLGYMHRPRGHCVAAHSHKPIPRTVTYTREVIFVKSGLVRVHLYDEADAHVTSRVLRPGDVILLAAGGHGFEFIEDSELIEVKQGPYPGEDDKRLIQGNPF